MNAGRDVGEGDKSASNCFHFGFKGAIFSVPTARHLYVKTMK
jgi:hypothetical protein